MDHTTEKIHVMPLEDQWEVETQSGEPLAHNSDKDVALEVAKELAHERHIETVILHVGNGVTQEIPVEAQS